MWSTPSRSSEASQACRTYSGEPSIPSRSPFSPRLLPNFVATTTWSRGSAIARPTRRSLVNGPYMSAVSRNVTPSSRARWIVAIASPWSVVPKNSDLPMQPRPCGETSSPLRPSVRVCIPVSFVSVSVDQQPDDREDPHGDDDGPQHGGRKPAAVARAEHAAGDRAARDQPRGSPRDVRAEDEDH